MKIHQAYLVAPTHQTFYLLCGVQRDILVHIPPHKGKTVKNTTFVWVYFLQMTHQLLTIKILPKCFSLVNKLQQWNYTSLPIIYFIKYSCGGSG